MNISEFKYRVSLISGFVSRMNEEAIPNDIKKAMVKVYANTLRIHLSDRMVDNLIQAPDCSMRIESLPRLAQS